LELLPIEWARLPAPSLWTCDGDMYGDNVTAVMW
jgi:hypothetical protein